MIRARTLFPLTLVAVAPLALLPWGRPSAAVRTPGPVEAVIPQEAVILVEVLGQSNAWGTQSFIQDVADPSELEGLGERAFIWNKIGGSSALELVDDGAWAPLDVGYGRSGPDSIGPELALAAELLRMLDRPVYVVKCARGETPLMQLADRTDWHPHSEGEVFELWRDYYHRPALAALVDEHGAENVFLAGVTWFQGAADAKASLEPAAQLYIHNLGLLGEALRAELGSSVPLLIGRSENYAPTPQLPHIDRVRLSQTRYAESTAGSTWFSTDLRLGPSGEVLFPFGPDGHHFNGQAQVHLGRSIAAGLTRIGYLWPVSDPEPTR